MPWNWELSNWPKFSYNRATIAKKEKKFLLEAGSSAAFLKNIVASDNNQFIVEILSTEGIESSRIEGEFLDRESLQSSIKKHFGLKITAKKDKPKEIGMANSFEKPLTHKMLYDWHSMLFENQSNISEIGKYRSHAEPMQITLNRYDLPKVFFKAPPSKQVYKEMSQFIDWFNSSESETSLLGRASIAHVYFESIHPFEDGNGRIGRILVEKILSQGIGRPILIAISKILEQRKKEYYAALESCNRKLNADIWVDFFTEAILQAQNDSMRLLHFLISKAKLLARISSMINERQEKVLLRMFEEGPNGFKGGLSAENYIKITKTSRSTATRDLINLVEIEALIKTGELRHTRYWLNLRN